MSLIGFRARRHPQQLPTQEGPRLFDVAETVDENASVDDRATDPALFAEWHARYCFTVDVAASAENARLPRYYTLEDDGLAQSWAGERVWCNPPYSRIKPWIEKAWRAEAELVVMLLPANRTEQPWWQALVEPYRDCDGGRLIVKFLSGRLRFVAPGATRGLANERPPFGCCLLIWQLGEVS